MAKPELNPFIAPSDPDGLIAWLEKKREANKGRVSDLMMRQNLAFVLGHQWIIWDDRQNRFRRPSNHRGNPNAPVRITANKIGSLVERAIAKLTKSAPIPETRPVTDDESDIDAAKVGSRILDSELYRLDWDPFLTSFWFWPATLGFSYVYVYWDPKKGKSVGQYTPQDGEPVDVFQGELCLEEVPAFELTVDPNAKSMEDARWAIRTTAMTREAVWEKFGKLVQGADTGRSLADDVFSLVSDDRAPSASKSDDFVKVHQYWLRPGGRSNPAGMVVTWAGKTILEGPTHFPYQHGRLPFIQANMLPGIGTREGRTWVTDLIPLQIDYNDARSREATIRRTLTPKIVAPTGSIDPRRVTSRVEVIDYAPTGAPPQVMIPDSGWMAQFEAGMQRADQEMGDRAGQQDVSRGSAPSASMPAAAILALQEADDTRLAISAKELASFVKQVGWQILQLVRQFWAEERIVRTWSEDGDLEVTHFTGADVGRNLDVHVSSESALPKSKAARAQLALQLAQQGLAPFTDPRVLIRLLDLPGTDFLADNLNRDARKAHRENGVMMHGQTPEVHPFDNHMVHLEEHHNEMKEAWYSEAQPTDPRRVAFDGHVAAHMELALGQLGVPTPPGTPQTHNVVPPTAPGGGPGPGAATPLYTSPTTGKPSDPVQVAAGQQPSSIAFGPSQIRQAAGIGGAGQPGQVPGVHPDAQAASMGK